MSYEVIVQILGRSPQGFTPFEILDHLLALPHYQRRSRSSIFAELLPVFQSLRDSQEVAHVSPRWVLVKAQEKTSEELSDQSTEQNLTELTLAIEQEAYPVVDISLDFANPVMTVEKRKETNNVNNAAFDFPIEILNLSKRAYHSLKRTRINTVAELQSYSDEYLLTIDGFGQTSLDDVKSVLATFQPPPYSTPTQELSFQPEWLKFRSLQIPTICLSKFLHLRQIVSKYSTFAHFVDAFEAGEIALESHQYEEIKTVITPFQSLRDASDDYLEWLASLSKSTLLDYLSKQSLPVNTEDIYGDLSQLYSVTRATVSMNLNLHANLFQKFGRSNLYGVAGRRYELPEQNLINLLVAKLEDTPVSLSDLEQDIDVSEYDAKTIYLYLNVSPIFCQTASNKERKFALSIEGKRQYQPGDASKIVADIFNQIREPLHAKDFLNLIRNSYAYPPGEQVFWRILTEEDYIPMAEAIFIPQEWWSDETLNFNLEDLDIDLFREITLFTIGSKRKLPPANILFDWLKFCYQNRFFYRGSLVYDQINLSELSDKKAQITRKIGQVCQRNGDTSVLAIGQNANSEEVDRSLRLDLEDLQQQAQSIQRTLSKGLASVQDGKYRVRYVGVGVEVYITKYGGTDNPCARVIQVLVNSEPYDPSRHNPIPTNTTTLDQRREALQKLYEAKLTAYGQIDSYLQVAIGSRPSWGIGYRQMELITKQATEDVA